MSRRARIGAVAGLGLALGLGAAWAWSLEPGAAPRPHVPVAFTTVAEVRSLLTNGTPMRLVDVRSHEEYLARHLPGAISIPLSAIEKRHREIPRQGLVVLY